MFEKSVNLIGPSRFDSIMMKIVTKFNGDGTKPIPYPYVVPKTNCAIPKGS